jgi:uncharacterized membrane protein YdjX (TVP38/TMEM64 family)
MRDGSGSAAAVTSDPTLTQRSPAKTVSIAALCVLSIAGICVVIEFRNLGDVLHEVVAAEADLHHLLAGLGVWGPLGFVAAYAVFMLGIWVPSWPLSVIGGFLFGPIFGTIYALVGSTLGAIGVFELTKSGLQQRIPRSGKLMQTLEAGFRRDALEYVIVLRVMPVMPFGIIHVAAAIFGIPLRIFVLGTVIGMVPCIAIYAILGNDLDKILGSGRKLDASTLLEPRVLLPLAALAALALVPIGLKRLRERRAVPAAETQR